MKIHVNETFLHFLSGSLYNNDVLMSSESPNLLNQEIFDSNAMENFPGNLAINSDSLDNYSVPQMESFEELLMEPDIFGGTEQSGEKEKKKRGRPRKNERNSDSSTKRSKNCFIFYSNINKLFSFILS